MCDVILVVDSLGEPVICECKLDAAVAAVRAGEIGPPVFTPVPAAFTVSYLPASRLRFHTRSRLPWDDPGTGDNHTLMTGGC